MKKDILKSYVWENLVPGVAHNYTIWTIFHGTPSLMSSIVKEYVTSMYHLEII